MKGIRAIIVLVSGGVAAACTSITTSELFQMPTAGSLVIDSSPPGAEARTSNGGVCRTPCEMELPFADQFTVTYTLDGYAPQTVMVRSVAVRKEALIDVTPPDFRPNPVRVELKPAPPPEPPPPPPPKKLRAQPQPQPTR
jgi:hypothetical protein